MSRKIKSLRTRKCELFDSVQPMSGRNFRALINDIISKNRNITLDEAKPKKDVQHIEVIEFLSAIGEDVNNYALQIHDKAA